MRRSEAEGRLPKATAKPPARARGEAFEVRCESPKVRFSTASQPPPQTPPSRARWRAERSEGTPIALQSPVGLARGASNDFHWTLGGLFSRNAPSGAGRGAEVFFLCRCFSRDKGGAIPTGQGPSRPDGRFAAGPGRLIYLQPANIGKLLWSPRPVVVSFSSRGAAARRALFVSSSTPIYPFYIGRPAAPPRHETQLRAILTSAVASAPTLRLQTELPTPRCLRPSLVGPPTARR